MEALVDRSCDAEDTELEHSEAEADQAPDVLFGFTSELPDIELHKGGSTTTGARALSVVNLHNLTGFPVLSCFISCGNALQIEALTDQQAGGMLQCTLIAWLGKKPPKREAVHVTRWAQDEYSRGSYSHTITGMSEAKHREAFQEPVQGEKGAALRSAGEHTSRNHFAIVHGALLRSLGGEKQMLYCNP